MCGIVGILSPGDRAPLHAALDRALDRLRHRGPDDSGVHTIRIGERVDAPVAVLGNRRLSIVDLTSAGHQPMRTADGRWTVVQNGEIYNFRELREELAQLGSPCHTDSDTEVLLVALATWGTAAFARCTGMFAVAAVDRHAGLAYLARDPMGIKPLYYSFAGDALVFASEQAALLEFPGISRDVNAEHAWSFLALGASDYGEDTLFAGIRQVPAAHVLTVPLANPRAITPHRFWQLDLTRERSCGFAEAADLVRETFLAGLALHLRSDAPLGFSLSGGLDSAAVLLGARHLLGPQAELHAFTFVADEPSIDESAMATATARAAGALLHPLRLTAEDLRRDIEALAATQGEPFSSPVIFAQYRIFGLARERGMKVLLGGQGADEILGGYDRYLVARAASLLRQGRALAAARLMFRSVSPVAGTPLATMRSAVARALPASWQRALIGGRRARRTPMPWLNRDWFASRSVGPRPEWTARGRRVLRAMMAHNLLESQVQALLRYEDRSAMAFSIENRVPFLTPPLVELLFSLPEEYLVAADGTRKAVMRRAMRGLVPDAIIDQRDKRGFSVPTLDWFDALRPWLADRLVRAAELPCLDHRMMHMRRAALLAGAEGGDPYLLWRCVSFAEWVDQFHVTFG